MQHWELLCPGGLSFGCDDGLFQPSTDSWLLRWGGSFCLVHKPERLADLCCALRARGLEPKRLRLVCRRAGDAPSLLLLEARRGGRPGLDIAAPLCLEDGTGRPTAELDNAYFRTKETNA